jgi:uncharacterized protein
MTGMQPPPPRTPGPPQLPAPMSPEDERTWATLTHLSPILAGLVGLPFLGPLIVMLVLQSRSRFVRDNSVEALNFQLSLMIYGLVAMIVTILTLGIALLIVLPLALVAAVLALVFAVVAAMAANRGEVYRYPLTIRMVR